MARKGYTVLNYIDDFWVQGDSFSSCQQAQIEGFLTAWDKCSSPAQHCTYSGLSFDLCNMIISLPEKKLLALHTEL